MTVPTHNKLTSGPLADPIVETRSVSTPASSADRAPRLVPLPEGPKTASPVPWLTSIHATPGRGQYGDAGYRGNCSGLLIKDLLMYYRPKRVLDPMTGGGTCRDVCRELNIECVSCDLRSGRDATASGVFLDQGLFDFIWLHPPYWKMIRWSNDPRCLANAPTLRDFLQGLRRVMRNCVQVLRPSGVLVVLMGDLRDQGHYQALPFRTLNLAYAQGLTLAAPEIIRFSHGTTSARQKEYSSSFIPRLHDVCLVLRQAPPQSSNQHAA
ncbi:MAG: hypothetical protein SGJ19_06810 [Planctomycetia bacterium]|nr:hypothetical protein [Planctomycetia bacterium]